MIKKVMKNIKRILPYKKGIGVIVSAIIAITPVILGIRSCHVDDIKENVIFNLEVSPSNPFEVTKELKIIKVGGNISNAEIRPFMQLEVELRQGNDKFRRYNIEFSDFYETNIYAYNYSDGCFNLKENNIERLYLFMRNLNDDLKKYNTRITTYAVKQYFQVSYKDFKGKENNIILESMNNYNHYFVFDRIDAKRYFNDFELSTIKKIPKSDILMPIFNDEHMVNTIFDSGFEIVKGDNSNVGDLATSIEFNGFLKDEKNLGIGFREKVK